jgi:hypothetical protein
MKHLQCVVLAALVMIAASPSQATVLLDLVDSPAGTTAYNLLFTATATDTTLSVAGYDVIAFEDVYDNSVSTTGGPNLLGGSWSFTPAASGSLANTFDDGTSVPGLIFGGLSVGFYDTFSQTFATTPGETYGYSFTFTQGHEGPSALVVTATAAAATPTVPEPSTWAMLLLGFVGLGFAGYRASRKGVRPPEAFGS